MANTTQTLRANPGKLLPGELVEVRSEAEILATLNDKGALDNLPFMPEMLKFCGQTFRVSAQAFKTCVDDQEMRQFESTVFLEEARCNGGSHGGCNRACLIFWKEAWLKRSGSNSKQQTADSRQQTRIANDRQPGRGGEYGLKGWKSTASNGFQVPKVCRADLESLAMADGKFFCQSSEILKASQPLPWWQPKQYLWDLKYNRVSIVLFIQSLLIAFYNKVAHVCQLKSWRFVAGSAGEFQAESLNLQPGELVRVKSLLQIQQTLDSAGKHQNLLFAPTMLSFCGQVLRVQDRVENIVLEATSRQRKIKDTVLLEGATCDGICHRLCPRQSFLFWRECWLERVSTN